MHSPIQGIPGPQILRMHIYRAARSKRGRIPVCFVWARAPIADKKLFAKGLLMLYVPFSHEILFVDQANAS
ncbi:hypothetical protein ACX3P1_07370 [Mesorhizobium sp. A623]